MLETLFEGVTHFIDLPVIEAVLGVEEHKHLQIEVLEEVVDLLIKIGIAMSIVGLQRIEKLVEHGAVRLVHLAVGAAEQLVETVPAEVQQAVHQVWGEIYYNFQSIQLHSLNLEHYKKMGSFKLI